MSQILKKASFASGLVLLFAPVIFSVFLLLIVNFKNLLEEAVFCVICLVIGILEVTFFIKMFKAYRLRDPYVYHIIYFLGILATLEALSFSLLAAFAYHGVSEATRLMAAFAYHGVSEATRLIFCLILLFAIFSFRYQKERFLTATNSVKVKKVVSTFVLLAAAVGMASYFFTINLTDDNMPVLPCLLSAIFSLVFLRFWKKKVGASILRSFFFLPGFYIIVTNLVLEPFAIYRFFKAMEYFGNFPW